MLSTRFFLIEFIFNRADQFLQHVLQGHQSERTSVFVHDEREMQFALEKEGKELFESRGLWDKAMARMPVASAVIRIAQRPLKARSERVFAAAKLFGIKACTSVKILSGLPEMRLPQYCAMVVMLYNNVTSPKSWTPIKP